MIRSSSDRSSREAFASRSSSAFTCTSVFECRKASAAANRAADTSTALLRAVMRSISFSAAMALPLLSPANTLGISRSAGRESNIPCLSRLASISIANFATWLTGWHSSAL